MTWLRVIISSLLRAGPVAWEIRALDLHFALGVDSWLVEKSSFLLIALTTLYTLKAALVSDTSSCWIMCLDSVLASSSSYVLSGYSL